MAYLHLTSIHFSFSAPVYRKHDYIKLIAERERKAEEARIKKEEDDKKKKEEAEKKKKEAEDKKKEEKKDEKKEEGPKPSFLSSFTCSFFDILLKPIEDRMDSVLGNTIDPFTGRLQWSSSLASQSSLTHFVTYGCALNSFILWFHLLNGLYLLL